MFRLVSPAEPVIEIIERDGKTKKASEMEVQSKDSKQSVQNITDRDTGPFRTQVSN